MSVYCEPAYILDELLNCDFCLLLVREAIPERSGWFWARKHSLRTYWMETLVNLAMGEYPMRGRLS